MFKKIDFNLTSKIMITLIIASITGYAFLSFSNAKATDPDAQSEKMVELIDKALLQCYALEGIYPPEEQFEEKMLKYGVILNREKYIFYYNVPYSNIKPDIKVLPK